MKADQIGSNVSDFQIITWVLGNLCNYSCSYCPHNLHAGDQPFPSIDRALAAFNQLRDPTSRIYLDISGGEPTLWKDLQKFIKSVSTPDDFIELSSNASRGAAFWQSFEAPVDLLYLSFHPEKANERVFTQSLESLHDRYTVHVAILVVPEYFEKCLRFFRYLAQERTDLNINVTPTLIRENFDSYSIEGVDKLLTELWSITKKNRAKTLNKAFPHDLIVNNKKVNWRKFQLAQLNNFKGMSCFAPSQRKFIDEQGDIFWATCKVGDCIGNIWKNFKLPNTSPVSLACERERCACKLDALIPKTGIYKMGQKFNQINNQLY